MVGGHRAREPERGPGSDRRGSGRRRAELLEVELAVAEQRLAQQRFGGDPSIIGRTLRFDDEHPVVVGVLPASFGTVQRTFGPGVGDGVGVTVGVGIAVAVGVGDAVGIGVAVAAGGELTVNARETGVAGR